jgi:drug/metabolite transporter (DMT)-like permease
MSGRLAQATGLIAFYSMVIGFADNYVRVIAADGGLWQFHATRSVLALALIVVLALAFARPLRPRNPGAVAARSIIHGTAMLVYFGALAFLPVAVVAAGLFTAPLFVLVLNRVMYAEPIRLLQLVAVALGFGGVVLMLGPTALSGATAAALLPVAAGALYALGNIATMRWCAGEEAGTLLAGFFGCLLVFGLIGMAALALWPLPVPEGAAGFVLRGPVWPSSVFTFWVAVQAVLSVVGVGMMIRAYQIAPAATVAVLEYMILPITALWTWILWGEALTAPQVAGMVLIVAAGIAALRQPPVASRQ